MKRYVRGGIAATIVIGLIVLAMAAHIRAAHQAARRADHASTQASNKSVVTANGNDGTISSSSKNLVGLARRKSAPNH